MNEITKIKAAIEQFGIHKADIAEEIGWSRQRFHAFLEHGKRVDIADYLAIRKAIEDRGGRIDGTETMSVVGLAQNLLKQLVDFYGEITDEVDAETISERDLRIVKIAFSRIDETITDIYDVLGFKENGKKVEE